MKNLIVLDVIQGIQKMVLMNKRCTQSLKNLILLFLVIRMETLSNRLRLLINEPTIRLKCFSPYVQKGVTTTEIAHLMEHMYDHHYTPQGISTMIKAMSK